MLRIIALALLIASPGAPSVVSQRPVDPLIVNSEDPSELQQLAVQFIASNQLRQALLALRKSVGIYSENAESHMWLGVVYTQLDEFEEAEAELRAALRINPQLTETHNWFGVH
ncbi:MAG TPA: tetratricopeptide repeat protein [Acidobacteriota bacterium]|nr:tetratricopeptide repeat protein [Acidobacteriota bacterium]